MKKRGDGLVYMHKSPAFYISNSQKIKKKKMEIDEYKFQYQQNKSFLLFEINKQIIMTNDYTVV